MRTYRTVWLVLLSLIHGMTISGKMYQGTITLKHKWSGLRPAPGSFQYDVIVSNIESGITRTLQDDPAFRKVKITKIRVLDKANRTSNTEEQFAADFNLLFLNVSDAESYRKPRFELEKLFSAVREGHLEGIPLEANSLKIQGISEIAHEIPITETQWPSGNYGLPKPKSGCPNNEWVEGLRYHDSEDHSNGNYHSNRSHLAGKLDGHGIEQTFCMHHERIYTADRIRWPRGEYCIYKNGHRCPTGLHEGWIRWDDEDSNIDFPSKVRGDVPEGIYGDNTVIYFCCSKKGSKSVPIHLPYGPPFYLLAFGSPKCQQVQNYEVSKEFVQFDDEDQGNMNAHSRIIPYGPTEDPYNIRLYYCYYKPVPCEKLSNRPCLKRHMSGIELEARHRKTSLPRNEDSYHGSAFATGSAFGAILFGVAVFAITTKRFLSFHEAAIADTRWN